MMPDDVVVRIHDDSGWNGLLFGDASCSADGADGP
jgi:hypothetical protein